jgi:transcriptional regulator with PAS, ATPase and Fis domain
MNDAFVFESLSIKTTVEIAKKFANSEAAILLCGESGTGKEVFANLIHTFSARSDKPLISINCANIPKELFESEMFGADRGAYTGCHQARNGLVDSAHGGTLFLDELSEMPLEVQPKLLRLLQDGDYRRVGSSEIRHARIRVLASTNMPPDECIKKGKLRADLYYRISTVTLPLPPLRERLSDIEPLALSFIRRICAIENRKLPQLTTRTTEVLRAYHWPGNIRQLYSEMYRAVLLSEEMVLPEHLSPFLLPSSEKRYPLAPDSKLTLMEAQEKGMIFDVLNATNWNKAETAKRLGIGRQTLYNKMWDYNIRRDTRGLAIYGNPPGLQEPDQEVKVVAP